MSGIASPGRAAVWHGVLDASRREIAIRVARDVAERVTDPARVAAALAATIEQTRYPVTLARTPYAVGDGDAGIALTCAYLDACLPGEGWDTVGHAFLSTATRGVEHAPPALFGGLSGLAFATVASSRDGSRYRRLLAAVDGRLAPRAAECGERLKTRSAPGPVSAFDVISGASGIGAYLLTNDPHTALPEILGGLVALAREDDGPPRWMTPPDMLSDPEMAEMYPHGNLNCGLAHGIPGPLALLSVALRAGIEVPGQADAIRRIVRWLVAQRFADEWGVDWPAAVPVPPGRPEPVRYTRAAWCYGSPGVARALWLAGRALGDDEPCELAVEAMRAVLRRPVERRGIPSPTFCHGVAGLLQIVLRFAGDTGLFRREAAELVDQILAGYQPERPLAYASIEPCDNPVDRAGLLDGAPGVALVLLAAATDVEPIWDRLFLLS